MTRYYHNTIHHLQHMSEWQNRTHMWMTKQDTHANGKTWHTCEWQNRTYMYGKTGHTCEWQNRTHMWMAKQETHANAIQVMPRNENNMYPSMVQTSSGLMCLSFWRSLLLSALWMIKQPRDFEHRLMNEIRKVLRLYSQCTTNHINNLLLEIFPPIRVLLVRSSPMISGTLISSR